MLSTRQIFAGIITTILIILAITMYGCGTSNPTTATGGTTSTTPPVTPLNASATAGNTQNTITWSSVSGATSYKIYFAINSTASTSAQIKTANQLVSSNANSPQAHIGLSNGTPYSYVVTAVNSAGESNPSNVVSATPLASLPLATPASLSATAISSTQINLNWVATGGATSYNIYSSTTPNFLITGLVPLAATASTSFSHTGLVQNTTHYYKVTAIINASESNPSNEASASTPPLIPTGLTATASGTKQINLSWNAVAGASGYNIYYSTTANPVTKANASGIITVMGNISTLHPNLTPGTTYYYSIAAIGTPSSNISDVSTTVSATTVQIGINWTAVNSGTTITLNDITYANNLNLWVAVGNSGVNGSTILTSPDGINWTTRTNPGSQPLNAISWSGTQFVAVGGTPGMGSSLILTSPDGTNWVTRTSSTFSYLESITYLNNLYICGDEAGNIQTSSDGITWTIKHNSTQGAVLDFAGSGNIVIGSYAGGWIASSSNGINWTGQSTITTTKSLYGIVWTGNQFVACTAQGGTGGGIITSINSGATWISQTVPVNNDLWDIAWTGNQLVAVGNSGIILTSSDSVNWVSKTNPATGTTLLLSGVAYGQGKLITVGSNGTILVSQ